jgi:Spy/CpxP family protein refolding chaperone
MKRIVLALCISAVATLAVAQESYMKLRMMAGDGSEAAATLGLSSDQQAQWDSIHQQLQADVEPLFQQLRPAIEQLESLASSSNPDVTSIGKQFLAVRSLEKQIKATHDSAHQKLAAVLTPDQKAKFESLSRRIDRGAIEMHMHHPGPGSRE